MRTWIRPALALTLLAFFVPACGDMPTKRSIPDNLQKVYIPPVDNKTGQPDVDQKLTQKITQNFIIDGRLTVVSKEESDIILTVSLQRYDRIVLTKDANNVPQQYKLQLIVDMDLTNAKTGEQMWTTRRTVNLTPTVNSSEPEGADWDSTNVRSLREFTTFYVLNNVGVPPEDENVALDRVLDQMARRVVTRTIEGF